MLAPHSIGTAPRVATARRPIPYRRHNCTRNHRTIRTTANCIWNRYCAWIIGAGPYATASHCRRGSTTVMLHQTPEAAIQALDAIDAYGCGGVCTRNHQFIVIAVAR